MREWNGLASGLNVAELQRRWNSSSWLKINLILCWISRHIAPKADHLPLEAIHPNQM